MSPVISTLCSHSAISYTLNTCAKEGLTLGILQKHANNENVRKAYHKMNIAGNLKMVSLEFIEARR